MTPAEGTGVVIRDAINDDVSAIRETVRGMAEDSASPITATRVAARDFPTSPPICILTRSVR